MRGLIDIALPCLYDDFSTAVPTLKQRASIFCVVSWAIASYCVNHTLGKLHFFLSFSTSKKKNPQKNNPLTRHCGQFYFGFFISASWLIFKYAFNQDSRGKTHFQTHFCVIIIPFQNTFWNNLFQTLISKGHIITCQSCIFDIFIRIYFEHFV